MRPSWFRTPRRWSAVWVGLGFTVLVLVNPIITLAIPMVVAGRELTRPGVSCGARWRSTAGGCGLLVALAAVVTAMPDTNVVMDEPLDDVIGLIAVAVLGLPLAAAVAVVSARRSASPRPSDDRAQQIVTSATSGLPRRQAEWGAAMRAELAAISDRRERRRFALGCALVAARLWLPRRVWVSAGALAVATIGLCLAGTVLAADTGRRDWTSVPLLLWTALVVATFVAAAVTAWRRASYRAGLIAGSTVLVLPAVAFHAVTIPGLRAWYAASGVSVSGNPLPASAGLAFPWTWVVLSLAVWVACPVLGASAGEFLAGWRSRRGAAGVGQGDEGVTTKPVS